MDTQTKRDGDKAYILVIDDDPLLTKTLKRALERVGYFVDVAQSGEEGILKAKSGYFHLILCDVRMPGLDGIMTLQRIEDFQKKAGAGKSGFIMISAFESENAHRQAITLGVSEFIRKPFDLSVFLQTIDHHMMPLIAAHPAESVQEYNQRLERLLKAVHEYKNDHTAPSV